MDTKKKKRIEHEYKVNDEVLIKNMKRLAKFDPLFTDPYSINEIGKTRQNVLIKDDSTEIWHYIKNIKPSWKLHLWG